MIDTDCSKCGKPLDTSGNPKWCRACRAEYQREYQAKRRELEANKLYRAGAEDMREALAKRFDALGSGSMTGYTCAGWIIQFRMPETAEPANSARP